MPFLTARTGSWLNMAKSWAHFFVLKIDRWNGELVFQKKTIEKSPKTSETGQRHFEKPQATVTKVKAALATSTKQERGNLRQGFMNMGNFLSYFWLFGSLEWEEAPATFFLEETKRSNEVTGGTEGIADHIAEATAGLGRGTEIYHSGACGNKWRWGGPRVQDSRKSLDALSWHDVACVVRITSLEDSKLMVALYWRRSHWFLLDDKGAYSHIHIAEKEHYCIRAKLLFDVSWQEVNEFRKLGNNGKEGATWQCLDWTWTAAWVFCLLVRKNMIKIHDFGTVKWSHSSGFLWCFRDFGKPIERKGRLQAWILWLSRLTSSPSFFQNFEQCRCETKKWLIRSGWSMPGARLKENTFCQRDLESRHAKRWFI